MNFDRSHFDQFSASLLINTKERGVLPLGANILGTQRRWLEEIQAGLEDGVHEFVTLKSRQIGLSTIMLAFDLYWPFGHRGLSGSIVVHDEAARDDFRAKIDMLYSGLPNAWRQGVRQHNRNQLVLSNDSTLLYKVAGTSESSRKTLGRSAALSFLHATEIAFWGDPDQIDALRATLAKQNPARFYSWETTANGYNHFWEMWEDAKRSVTKRAIFIGWWANEFYRAPRDSLLWKTYWGARGKATREEKEWMREVASVYGVKIDDEQLAWYRYMRAEEATNEAALLQEYPSLPEQAFQATGSLFFTSKALKETYTALGKEDPPARYRIEMGTEFDQTQVVPVKKAEDTTLCVWEEPQKKAFYVIGADPAYGWNANSDGFCVHVSRAWSNRLEQVAEFCVPGITTFSFAWIITYLAGAYEPSILNLEINGPGEAVLNEIQNLKKTAQFKHVSVANNMFNVVRHMQHYFYRRLDQIGGMPTALHTLSNERVKDSMMNTYRDYYERGIVVVHSKELVAEMQHIRRPADGGAPSASKGTDDRVIGAVLACRAWNDQLRTRLIAQNVTWSPPEEQEDGKIVVPDSVVGRQISSYLTQIGVKRPLVKDERGTRMYRPPK